MADRYQTVTNSPIGRALSKRLGLPIPARLERHGPGRPVAAGPVLLGGEPGGKLLDPARQALEGLGAEVTDRLPEAGTGGDGAGSAQRGPAALVFDASGIAETARLRALYEFFHPAVRGLGAGGRVVVLATPPFEADGAAAATAQRAIEGFVRSVGKEVGGKGATAQLVEVAEDGEGAMESTLRFLLSARSAYVSGQVIRIARPVGGEVTPPKDWERPLAGRVGVVTGGARGIGAAIAEVLTRDGAEVVCVDVPAQGDELSATANRVGGSALQLDITEADAGRRIAEHCEERHGRLDLLVHNAGITRDKTLGRMSAEQWDSVIEVNLSSQERINLALLDEDAIRSGGRIVSVSSVSGIAGNRGQSNYAASKAGIIGMVEAMAAPLAERGATINAVAPGFIETAMTAAMPLATREAGRRANSLAQGGQPVDVAETIAWLASPGSGGINGNVVRVCGQQLLGA